MRAILEGGSADMQQLDLDQVVPLLEVPPDTYTLLTDESGEPMRDILRRLRYRLNRPISGPIEGGYSTESFGPDPHRPSPGRATT